MTWTKIGTMNTVQFIVNYVLMADLGGRGVWCWEKRRICGLDFLFDQGHMRQNGGYQRCPIKVTMKNLVFMAFDTQNPACLLSRNDASIRLT
jgi:hypothetical protein